MVVSKKELSKLVGNGGIAFTSEAVIKEGLTIAQMEALALVDIADDEDQEHWDTVEEAVGVSFDKWLEEHDDALLEEYGLKKATLPPEFDME